MTLEQMMQQVERQLIESTLRRCDYHKDKAAKLLGIARSTLFERLTFQVTSERRGRLACKRPREPGPCGVQRSLFALPIYTSGSSSTAVAPLPNPSLSSVTPPPSIRAASALEWSPRPWPPSRVVKP
jgi:hypothetical protein